MADKNVGKIIQVISAVLDIKFSEGNLPEINDAVEVPLKNGGKLVVEVAQHLGDDTVRCIAMGPTDGLVRGMDAIATGAPISVPVGENTICIRYAERVKNDGTELDVENLRHHRNYPPLHQGVQACPF